MVGDTNSSISVLDIKYESCYSVTTKYLPLLKGSGDLSRKTYDAELGIPFFILHKVVLGIGARGSSVYRLYGPLLAITIITSRPSTHLQVHSEVLGGRYY